MKPSHRNARNARAREDKVKNFATGHSRYAVKRRERYAQSEEQEPQS